MGGRDRSADDRGSRSGARVSGRPSRGVAHMHRRSFRRAAGLALAGLLAFAGVASADFVRADGDLVQPGSQTFIDLGQVAPSAEITVPVSFALVCGHLSHVDAGPDRDGQPRAAPRPRSTAPSWPRRRGRWARRPAAGPRTAKAARTSRPTVETGTPGSITLRAPSVVGSRLRLHHPLEPHRSARPAPTTATPSIDRRPA